MDLITRERYQRDGDYYFCYYRIIKRWIVVIGKGDYHGAIKEMVLQKRNGLLYKCI